VLDPDLLVANLKEFRADYGKWRVGGKCRYLSHGKWRFESVTREVRVDHAQTQNTVSGASGAALSKELASLLKKQKSPMAPEDEKESEIVQAKLQIRQLKVLEDQPGEQESEIIETKLQIRQLKALEEQPGEQESEIVETKLQIRQLKELDDSRDEEIPKAPCFSSSDSSVQRIPRASDGLALGLVGLGSLWAAVGTAFGVSGLQTSAVFLYMLSFSLFLLRSLRIICNFQTMRQELNNYESAYIYGAWVMTLNLLSNILVTQVEGAWWLGAIGVATASVMQCCITVWFSFLCYREKKLPEPLWNPPTVSIAMIGWTGINIGMDKTLAEGFFWMGVVMCFITTPIQMWRVLRDPENVAPDASCAMLMAPASFMVIAWYAIGGLSHAQLCGIELVHLLEVMSTATFVVTVYALYKRHRCITDVWFSPNYASFTFPFVSTASAACEYGAEYPSAAANIWARVLFVSVSFVVVVVATSHFYQLQGWINTEKALACKHGSGAAGMERKSAAVRRAAVQPVAHGIHGEAVSLSDIDLLGGSQSGQVRWRPASVRTGAALKRGQL
jgi:hypothetical protein